MWIGDAFAFIFVFSRSQWVPENLVVVRMFESVVTQLYTLYRSVVNARMIIVQCN